MSDMPSPLVSASALADLLADRTVGPVTLLDVRYQTGAPDGRGAYLAGHLPGAVYVDMDEELAAPAAEPDAEGRQPGGRHPLPETADFEAAMRRAGVRADRPVVVYDDWGGRSAARAWWLLRYHGHADVRVLDGGRSAWLAAGGQVERGLVTPEPGDFTAVPGGLPVVDTDDVAEVEVLVDARAPERYAGEHEPIDPVAGHVPGAVNVPTSDNLRDDGRFRDAEDLRAVYAAVGAVPGADVAAYCGSGVTACHDILAMTLARVPAALWAGSWSDWVSDPARPVAGRLEADGPPA
jgi:thiosulfate/3-mercaptopyruvate sulfurtransferase